MELRFVCVSMCTCLGIACHDTIEHPHRMHAHERIDAHANVHVPQTRLPHPTIHCKTYCVRTSPGTGVQSYCVTLCAHPKTQYIYRLLHCGVCASCHLSCWFLLFRVLFKSLHMSDTRRVSGNKRNLHFITARVIDWHAAYTGRQADV